jgi:hypothetical protein
VREECSWAEVDNMPAVVNPRGLMNVDKAVFIRAIVAVQSE